MASIDELKTLASSRLGFAKSNQFLVSIEPLGAGGLAGLLAGKVTQSAAKDAVATQLDGLIPKIPGVFNETLPTSREINILCKNAVLPGKQILTSERRIAMQNQKVAYGYGVADVALTFYLLNDYGIMHYLNAWQDLILDETTHIAQYKNTYAKNIVIHQLRRPVATRQAGPISLDLGGQSIYSVELLEAFPTTIGQIDLNNDLDGLVEITVNFSYTRHRQAEVNNNFVNVNINPGQIF